MRRDPFARDERVTQTAVTQYFTNREGLIETFNRYVNASPDMRLKVLVLYGVGGIGKTSLVCKLIDDLCETKPPIPSARFNIETIGDQTQAYREVLLRLRTDLETGYGVHFPSFDLCWAVMMAHVGSAASHYLLLRRRPGGESELSPTLSRSVRGNRAEHARHRKSRPFPRDFQPSSLTPRGM